MERDLIEQHKMLFRPFFVTDEELEIFIQEKLDYRDNSAPRRMLNSAQRLITLSDEIDVICPGRRDLSIFFLITCIESLYQFIPDHGLRQKQEMPIQFFDQYLMPTDRRMIEDGLKIISVNNEVIFQPGITIEQFALLLISIRNNVAHEGNYWSFSFNEEGYDGHTINVLNSKLRKDEGTREIAYEVGLTYHQFREACIRTFISFLNEHFARFSRNTF